jgi:hypothetical protein
MRNVFVILTLAVAGCSMQSSTAAVPVAASDSVVLPASYANHKTFRFTGKAQSFKVPHNVTSIFIIAIGGAGGGQPVSHGGRVSAVLPVAPGAVLSIHVGGNGASVTGGYNGGGFGGSGGNGVSDGYGGGGATDIRLNGKSIRNRVLVAGGGGGQGGSNGVSGPYAPYGVGGSGGSKTGANGAAGFPDYSDDGCYTAYISCGGGGGTPVAGGTGGFGGSGHCTGTAGSAGTLGQGGVGSEIQSGTQCGGLGGGGGGGYWGGGGGGQAGSGNGYHGFGGGGGGGGSSYVAQGATKVHMWRGWKENEYGLVVVHW